MFGNLVLLKRWHWLALSALIGLAAGFIATPRSLDLRDFGEGMNGRKEFENALVTQSEGRPRFKEIAVHRQGVTNPDNPDGESRKVWVVTGVYCGTSPDVRDGNWHWRPTFFLADEPYKPASNLAQLTGGASPELVGRFLDARDATVLDFLELLSRTRGVSYSHAWWRTYAFAVWFGGCVVVVGLVWPTAIDLIVYGRLVRPREPKGMKLTPSPAAAPVKPKVSDEDLRKLDMLGADLEQGLEAAASNAARPAPAAPPAAPVRALTSQPAPAASPAAAKEHKAFGANQDDFYPTERKAPGAGRSK